ncbi:MAG TPA: hypothetical protein VMH61_08340 [Candidatus Acidoferrales bacterium]|nr:hypothetical protein [Candidatus Acidoferrales bacterium]
MLRSRPAALLRAAALSAMLLQAALAPARAASPFEVVPRPVAARGPRRAAACCAVGGVGLVVASFPLKQLADRRYDAYLSEADPARIESRWDATLRADRMANGSLLAGEGLLALAVYLQFVRPSHDAPVALVVEPSRCALALRF